VLRNRGVARLKKTNATTTPARDASSGRMAARRSRDFQAPEGGRLLAAGDDGVVAWLVTVPSRLMGR
jgi:hypothetical protein